MPARLYNPGPGHWQTWNGNKLIAETKDGVTTQYDYNGNISSQYDYNGNITSIVNMTDKDKCVQYDYGVNSSRDSYLYKETDRGNDIIKDEIRFDATARFPLTTEGVKYDNGKPRMDLLPPELMTAVADILTFGAKKYAARNWEKGMDWSRPYSAAMRHMLAWWGGEEFDPESGKSHLHHAACNLAFLIAYAARQVGKDDRP